MTSFVLDTDSHHVLSGVRFPKTKASMFYGQSFTWQESTYYCRL